MRRHGNEACKDGEKGARLQTRTERNCVRLASRLLAAASILLVCGPVAADQKEAEDYAKKVLRGVFTIVTADGKETAISGGVQKEPLGPCTFGTYYQYRELRGKVISVELSEADKLNGVTWRGYVDVKASAFRELKYNSYACDGSNSRLVNCWGTWVDFPKDVTFRWAFRKTAKGWTTPWRIDHKKWVGDVPVSDFPAPTQPTVKTLLEYKSCD